MTMNTARAQAILSEAQQVRFIVEDFRPLAESLEWELGQHYLRERGSRAFLSDTSPVPFVINNDGVLSRQGAETFFNSLVQAEKTGPLGPKIFVLDGSITARLPVRMITPYTANLPRTNPTYWDEIIYLINAGYRIDRGMLLPPVLP